MPKSPAPRVSAALASTLSPLAAGLALAATPAPPADHDWQRISARTLDGIGLPIVESAGEDNLPSTYFKDIDPPVATRFAMLHSNLIQTAVVETPSETTRSIDFPGDEVVYLESGQTILIDEPTGRLQVARAGDFFIVPVHWSGLWLFKPDAGRPAREHATVSAIDYSPRKPALVPGSYPANLPRPTVTVLRPSDIEAMKPVMTARDFNHPETAMAGSAFHAAVPLDGEPGMVVMSARGKVTAQHARGCESVVRVLGGTLELSRGGKSETFAAGASLVIKADFAGQVALSDGFFGVSVVSTGEGSPPWPGKAAPALSRCPAL